MSKQGMTALFERAQSDEAFLARLEAASSPDEKRDIATEAGFDLEPADMDTLRAVAGMTELSDEDLERVAGGGTGTDVGITAMPAAAAAAGAAAL